MVSTFTTNLNLELQGTGDHSGTWGSVLNTAALAIIDQAVGGVQTLTLASTNVTVNTSQSQNSAFKLTGTLTANVQVIFPAIGRTYFVANNTTGNFTVTLACAGGGSTVVIPQGRNGFFVLDTVNVIAQTDTDAPIGLVGFFAMTTLPTGWLECNGAAISRTTYAALYGVIGTTFGSGDGVTTFNIPDMRGYFVRGWDHGAGRDTGRAFGSTQTSQNLAHTHAFAGNAMPPHHHTVNAGSHDAGIDMAADGSALNYAFDTSGVSAGTPTGTNASSGGTEARPINIALLPAIKAV